MLRGELQEFDERRVVKVWVDSAWIRGDNSFKDYYMGDVVGR